jgi:hypothetical protein
MNATWARTADRFQDSMVSIRRVNLQVTARALLNCVEHERRSSLSLGAVTDPVLLDRLLGLPVGYPAVTLPCGRKRQPRPPAAWTTAPTGVASGSIWPLAMF